MAWTKKLLLGGGVHLMLDDGSLHVHFVLAGSEAVDAADPIQGLGELADLLGKKM